MKYKEIIELNGIKLTKDYTRNLSKEERISLIDPLFKKMREIGWMVPDFEGRKFYKIL